MCEFQKYGSFRIDPCLTETIDLLQEHDIQTIASCCGHGKYPKSIVVQGSFGGVYEYFTGKILSETPRKNHRYYKRDKAGIFYIPELLEVWGNI